MIRPTLLDIGSTERFLAGLNDWVAIESPTSESAAVNRMMDKVEAGYAALGARCERVPGRDGRGDHLIVRAPWGEPGQKGILCLAHLDTVHPVGMLARNPIRSAGGRAFGPGINDMKAGGHAVFAAFRALREAGATTALPLTFVYVADEETGSVTARAVIEAEAQKNQYALVLEPGRGNGAVVTSRKGVAMYALTVHGRPAHAGGGHREGRSALRELAHQIIAIEGMTDYGRGVTLNVGRAEGGSAANVVPEYARCTIDLRVPTPEDASEFDARLRALRPVTPEVTLEVAGGLNRAPYRKTDRPDIAALFEHTRALAADLGFALEDLPDGEKSGGSDGQFCVPYCAVLDGLGPYGGGSHTAEEWLDLATIPRRGNLLLHLLQTLA
jgi:glutamate carboxypeptidase